MYMADFEMEKASVSDAEPSPHKNPVNITRLESEMSEGSTSGPENLQDQPEPAQKVFDLETADANEVMDEIIRVTQVNYEYMKQRVANPSPYGPNGGSMTVEILKKYEEKDALLDLYFDRLKVLLQETAPGLTELQIQQRQLATVIKLNKNMKIF